MGLLCVFLAGVSAELSADVTNIRSGCLPGDLPATANTLEQFLVSPDLGEAFHDAVISSDDNIRTMSEQVLGSKQIQKAILELLAREF